MEAQILARLQKNGLEGSIVSAGHLPDIKREIDRWAAQNYLAPGVFNECLSWLEFESSNVISEARSIITVAIPDPQTRFVFTWNKRSIPVIVPPTYLHWQKANDRAKESLLAVLKPAGYSIVAAKLPAKLLAVRSGLGQYGKNNLCYVGKRGSFHRLICFYSDLPCTVDTWQEMKSLPRCEKCTVCRQSCPSHAIAGEHFLPRIERCLTYHNEKPGAIAFPKWLDPSWHNSLVGCMICQKVCPENRSYLHQIKPGAVFKQEETEKLLTSPVPDLLPPELERKLKDCDLIAALDILPRNLQALVSNLSLPPFQRQINF